MVVLKVFLGLGEGQAHFETPMIEMTYSEFKGMNKVFHDRVM